MSSLYSTAAFWNRNELVYISAAQKNLLQWWNVLYLLKSVCILQYGGPKSRGTWEHLNVAHVTKKPTFNLVYFTLPWPHPTGGPYTGRYRSSVPHSHHMNARETGLKYWQPEMVWSVISDKRRANPAPLAGRLGNDSAQKAQRGDSEGEGGNILGEPSLDHGSAK